MVENDLQKSESNKSFRKKMLFKFFVKYIHSYLAGQWLELRFLLRTKN